MAVNGESDDAPVEASASTEGGRGSTTTEATPVVGAPVVASGIPVQAHVDLPWARHRIRIKGRGWLMRRALAAADLFGITTAFVLSFLAFEGTGTNDTVGDSIELGLFVLSLPVWIVVANLYGLYDSDEERADHSTADDIAGVFHLITIGTWLLFVAVSLTGIADPGVGRLVFFWISAIVLVACARAVARVGVRHSDAFVQNTVIVGAGHVGQLLARKIGQHPEYGLNIVGFVDENPLAPAKQGRELTLLGGAEKLPEIVRQHKIERVIFSFSNESHGDTLELIRALDDVDVKIDIVPRLFEVLGPKVGVHTVEGVPLFVLPPVRLSKSSLLLKRLFDVVTSALALVLLAPLFLVAAIAIKLDSPGPVMFRQTRMGSASRSFRIYKFRTMRADADDRKHEVAHLNKHADEDPRMFKIPNDPRVTRVGAILRRFSIDELPQLINVVRGEMSIVGPRPLILEEDRHVVDWQRRRLHLKPGITGLWQVLGRDGIPFDEMVKLDYLYVSTWSIFSDLKLILRTIPVLFRSHSC